jgi:putative nucleotidyltransferase with HDIG domain
MGHKKPSSSKSKRSDVRSRHNYIDHSQRFLNWVDALGFEKTRFGKVMNYLDQRFHLRGMAFLFVFALVLSFLVFYEFDFSYQAQVGQVATADIKSPLSFEIVDEVATEEKRREAEFAVPPVFDYEPNTNEKLFSGIYTGFRTMRTLLSSFEGVKEGRVISDKTLEEFSKAHKGRFDSEMGAEISERIFDWLTANRFSKRLEDYLKDILAKWTSRRIFEAPPNSIRPETSSFLARRLEGEVVTEEFVIQREVTRNLRNEGAFTLADIRGANELRGNEAKNLENLARQLLTPNLVFNKQETRARRQKAREAVLPIQISIKKNQTIVSEGSVILPIHATLLGEIDNLKSDRRTDFMSLVIAAFFTTLIMVFFSYIRRFTTNRVKVKRKDLMAMGIVTLLTVFLSKVFLFVGDAAFLDKFGAVIPPTVFLFAAPAAAGPMLVGLLVASGELVWLFTAFLAVVMTFMVDMNFMFFTTALIGGIAAARGVYSCQKRNDIYWAGLRTGGVNALILTLLTLYTRLGEPGLTIDALWHAGAGLFSGLFSAAIAMMVIPVLESMFNYTTDVKLLELASLNHPLMKKMIVKAPGTYHHSLIVGSMCEAAAELIGANALLAKVMAYYHDIGKMEHAQYFIENQRQGYNPHDHISPHMSKTVLVAHVKDGAEMGIDHGLGEPIIDGILQHHGTTLISFFYNKAIEESDENIDNIKPDDFRYPGPKPQFKEAALVMLADSIEAAARSLDEPTPHRLQTLVKNIIQSKFLDGQLEECNLTLKDLSVIEDCFERVILGIYHQRIDYPKQKSLTENPQQTVVEGVPVESTEKSSTSAG